MAIRNTIGDAPPITTLIQCRDRGSQTLDPLDSRAWTMWRYSKYLSIDLQYLEDTSDLIIEAGMVKVIETLLKSTNRHIVQLFIAIFDLLPDYEKQALKEIDVAKTEAERKWLNFFLSLISSANKGSSLPLCYHFGSNWFWWAYLTLFRLDPLLRSLLQSTLDPKRLI